jgi:predicted MFS family arabinose efflux permease
MEAENLKLPSAGYVRYVIVLLCVITICNYMDRMALAVLSPLIKADLELSDAGLGLLIGLAFSLFYAVCGIPIARWADRGNRRNIIALAIGVWSVMTALCGAAQNFWHLFLARVGLGMGEAGSVTPGASILCDYVPLKRRSGALAVMGAGSSGGVLAGMVLAGWLGEEIGWRWTFVALGLPGIGLALLVRFTLREPVRGALDAAKDEKPNRSLRETVGFLWRSRTYRLITLYLISNGFVQYGLNQWWPSYYARMFEMSLSSIGIYLGVALGASGGLGVLAGGAIALRTGRRNVGLPLKISGWTVSASIPLVLASLFVPSVPHSIAYISLAAFFWGFAGGPVLAAQYSVVTSRMRATAGSLAIFLASVLGFGLGPFSVGVVSDLLAPSLGTESLRYALLVPAVTIAVMATALFGAARTLPADLEFLGAQPRHA